MLRATLNTPLTYASISDKNKDKLVRESSRNIENRDKDEKTENELPNFKPGKFNS